jgi:hypothetical protein
MVNLCTIHAHAQTHTSHALITCQVSVTSFVEVFDVERSSEARLEAGTGPNRETAYALVGPNDAETDSTGGIRCVAKPGLTTIGAGAICR